ncbi:ionotropic receptor 75a isoform X2 [Eurosta solidaginis]|uniref:ionotropic receptor 75a isoform X2 n=1 Tax=Eurosta solidaginis TaxID=178769 RepID=UPI0035312D6C
MASIQALFNSTYHWLLIEDYTFNRKAGNDDNDEGHKVYNKNNFNNVTNDIEYNELDSKNNNNNNSNNKNGNETDNRTDKFQQQKLQQKNTMSEAVISVGPVVSSPPASGTKIIFANTINIDAAATTVTNNEDDNMEIIEKYLEKINININTELILAKRHTWRIRDGNKVCASAVVADEDDGDDLVGSERCCISSSSSESATNNTLQREDYYQLYDVWSPGLQYGGQLNISEIGYFALDDGLQIALWYRRSTTITRRMDMKMARIRCLIVIRNKNLTDTLEHYLTTRYDTHLDSMHRFNFALLSHVRDLYNFSFILSKTSTWGYLKNGKFDGMIGALVRKQADIGGSPIFFRIERAKVIDYTSQTWVDRPCFIFRHPRSTKNDRIVFLQPFSNEIWILLGFCGAFSICLLWLLTTMERRFQAVGVVKQLGQSTRAMSINAGTAAAKQQSAIGGNDEVRVSCFSTRTTMTKNTTMTTSGNTMQCRIFKKKNLFDSQTKEQRKQKLRKLLKHNKVEEQKKVQRISFRHCMLGCGNACCGQTRHTDVVQQQQQGVSLFFESLLFYISSICQQGLTFSTNFFSGRCIVITSLLCAFAIYQFYCASIVGTLQMEKPKIIRTLRDLIHNSLEVGIEDIPYNRDYFLHTKDPLAIELYAKKVISMPKSCDVHSEETIENVTVQPKSVMTDAKKAKKYRNMLHSHENGAHAKTNEASNWYDPEYGVKKIRQGKFAFHVDVATAYKIIADTFTEKEICDLTEIQLIPPQKMVSIVQKGSPLRKMLTYGLRRITETGLLDYQRKVWHSPKPRCVKQIQAQDLKVDLPTFAPVLFILIIGYAASLLALSIEIIQHTLCQRYHEKWVNEDATDAGTYKNKVQKLNF